MEHWAQVDFHCFIADAGKALNPKKRRVDIARFTRPGMATWSFIPPPKHRMCLSCQVELASGAHTTGHNGALLAFPTVLGRRRPELA